MLLAYLAARPGVAHPRERLAALLWGETAEEQARNSLRQALFVLRKAPAAMRAGILLVAADGVRLDPDAVAVDVVTFERLVGRGDPTALEQAIEMYRGDLLDGIDVKEAAFDDWVRGSDSASDT